MRNDSERNMRRHLPRLWVFPIEFPLEDLGDNITEAEYNKWLGQYPVIHISVHFEFTPAEPEVGIPEESFEWNGDWSLPPLGNYPDRLKSAISAHLEAIDVNSIWSEKLAKIAESYLEQMLYPNL